VAAPDVTKTHWTQGRLTADGTLLGHVESVRLIPITRSYQLAMEEYGGEGGDVVEFGHDWVCVALIRGWDRDALNTVFATTLADVVTEPGITIGSMGSGRAVALVYTPDDSSDEGFTLGVAIPQVQSSHELNFSILNPLTIGVVFTAIRNGSGVTLTMGT